ncbi:dTDP-glucose 4,6-dehydratase [Dysgonomonas sp. 25]|uniref:dTDP-glucose 4,6-dehydratase n=1 Tax=Dysgonomonas sp. 25 TaxID=2302933 RepID=UPI0013D16A3A|nr:dTDP-glucose 4,6-dehydratase [Dysgonomonas sp. 25]NDV68415.1 dTDP-glucose 4,6-dehydratase [Dysgonomonas sp. 25]
MTYFITGGAGFIGSNFVKHMLAAHPEAKLIVFDALTYAGNLGTLANELKDARVTFVKGDICSREDVEKVFNEHTIDYVVNFAAESHVDRSIENPQLFLQVNILGTQNLLDVAKKAWTTGTDENGYPTWREGVKFLQVSTDEVYGSLGDTGYFTETTPLDPRSPYSSAKTGGDLIVRAYNETYKMPVNITRCSNNYGPYHFPEKLIPLIIRNILAGKPLPVYGDGSNVRDWLYVVDHCKAIDKVVHHGRVGEVYNIGGHNEKKNIDIVKLVIATIHNIMEKEPKYRDVLKKKEIAADGSIDISWINNDLITFVRDRQGHDQRYAIDPTKISTELDWLPETMFDEGIVKTIYWYLDNQDWVEEVTSGDYMKYYEQMYKDR